MSNANFSAQNYPWRQAELNQTLRSAALEPMARACSSFAPIAAIFKSVPEDFFVEEIAAYEPSGTGDHLFLWIEKTHLSAMHLMERVAHALKISVRDIGCAGLKDTVAVTRQYLSVPKACEIHLAALQDEDNITVLNASLHTNKLKTGHLKGNRFRIRLRKAGPNALQQAKNMLAHLQTVGLPNGFGPQRFGHDGHTAIMGAELIGLCERSDHKMSRSMQRLAVSALQSLVFNVCLRQRMALNLMNTVVEGDVMQVRVSGGPFIAEDVEQEQKRLNAGDIALTGPMPGAKMRNARHRALQIESQALVSLGLSWHHFAQPSKIMQGTRRPLNVYLEDVSVQMDDDDSLMLQFSLPKGSYATCVLRELTNSMG